MADDPLFDAPSAAGTCARPAPRSPSSRHLSRKYPAPRETQADRDTRVSRRDRGGSVRIPRLGPLRRAESRHWHARMVTATAIASAGNQRCKT